MDMLRSVNATGLGLGRQLRIMALAVVTAIALSIGTGTVVEAADLPFWEQADHAKARSLGRYQNSASTRYAHAYAGTRTLTPTGKQGRSAGARRPKLGGYAAETEPARKRKGVKVATLGNAYYGDYAKPKGSLSGGVRWAASSGCLDAGLKSIVYQIASNYGPVTVNSTCRSRGHNAAVGGAPRSQHLSGNAVDFRVRGNVGAVYAFLRSNGGVGGLKHYGGGLFHIDTGARRSR